jgi:hypothetical protein
VLGKKNRARCLIHISGDARTKMLQKVKDNVSKLRGVLIVDVSHITRMLSVENYNISDGSSSLLHPENSVYERLLF